MKIGIYKPFKKVFFHDDAEDNAAWSYEVTNVAKILAERGHTVYMLSETDLQDGVFENIKNYEELSQVKPDVNLFDRIILFSGTFTEDKHTSAIIDILRNMTSRLDFMLTDLRLVPEETYYSSFDNIYTQATKHIESIPAEQKYGGVAEFRLYKNDVNIPDLDESLAAKQITFYFGGTERGRLDDFIEYVWRHGHLITTKSAFFNIESRVTRDEYMRLLQATQSSVVIADVEYNKNHFITPRPYEYFVNDIVSFIDNKFDPDGHIIPLDSWLRVNNYKEMRTKMNELNSDAERHSSILAWQRSQITPDKVNGDYVYELIK